MGLAARALEHGNWRQRFIMGQYNSLSPFTPGAAGANYCWLFVEAESFATFLVSKSAPAPLDQADGKSPLSPYLRFMVALSDKLGLSPDNQMNKAALEAEIRAAWRGEPGLSNRLIESMATLMREPEIQLGRNRRRKDQ